VAATLWPVSLGAAFVDHGDGHARLASTVMYVAASRVCHQRAERSFQTHGRSWPVCGRCAGLYLAAPVAAWWAAFGRLRRRGGGLALLAAAAVPTVLTVVFEWLRPEVVTSLHRALAALPLGGAAAYVVTQAARWSAEVDRID
jgi:hypothetical protein